MAKAKNYQSKLKSLVGSAFKKKYVLAFILIIVYLAITVFTTQGLSLFNGGVTIMTDLEFYLMTASSILLGVGLLLLSFRHFKVKVNRPLLMICLILLILDIVAVSIFPSSVDGSINGFSVAYNIQISERIRYVFGWLVGDLALYIFVGVIPLLFRSHNAIDFWLWVGIGVGLLLMVASFIKEHELWAMIFKGINGDLRPQSITNNTNTFGFAILWSFSCALILYSKYHRIPVLILGILLALSALGIQSKTAVVCIGLEIFLSGIYIPLSCWKKRRKEAIAYLVVLAILLVFLILIIFVPFKPFEGVSTMLKNMGEKLLHLSGGTLTGRTDLWKQLFTNMVHYPTVLLFGTGDGVFESFVAVSVNTALGVGQGFPAHNGFLYVWGRFGILGLMIYLFGIGYLVYETINAIRKRKDIWAGALLIVLAGFLAHSLAEDDALLDMRLKGMMFLGILWWPLIISKKDWLAKNGKLQDDQEPFVVVFPKLSVVDILKTSYTISMLLLVLLVGFAPLYEKVMGSCCFNNTSALAGLTLLFLIGPLLIGETKKLKDLGSKTRFLFHLCSSLFVLVWGFVFAFISDSSSYPIALGISLIVLLLEGGVGLKIETKQAIDWVVIAVKVFAALVAVTLSHCLNAYLQSEITGSAIIGLLCLYLSLSILGLTSFPSAHHWGGCTDILWLYIEAAYEKAAQRQLRKSDERITSFF